MTEPGDRRSPLDAAHRRLGAKMVPFGGWDMPLAYPSGTIAEHLLCRRQAVAFDVSHLGTVRITGPAAFDRLQAAFTNDLAKIGPGRAQYTHLLDPTDASVVDDIIVWWVADDQFDVMPNASNTERVLVALTSPAQPTGGAGGATADLGVGGAMAAGTTEAGTTDAGAGGGGGAGGGAIGADVADVTSTRAIIAVQGPYARARLAAVAPEAASVPRFQVKRFEWQGAACVAAGTGYTGEDGVELAVPAEAAEELWQAVLATGIEPAGLGARDTLRLEAALPLHGHELGPGITSLQAGLGWVVAWDKPGGFLGKGPLMAERDRGVARKLAGLCTSGRQPPRQGCLVSVDGKPAGAVTSGNFSPILGRGIALALLPPGVVPEATIEIDVRSRPMPATLAALPFVKRGSRVDGAA